MTLAGWLEKMSEHIKNEMPDINNLPGMEKYKTQDISELSPKEAGIDDGIEGV